ncbi:MAG: VanZ family protein [Bacteroidetes bacterium]|nr:VanZ family protein [Bacteroidota bacterium]
MKRIFSFFIEQRQLTLFIAIVVTLTIFIGCSLPGSNLPKLTIFEHFDKIIHFLFFFSFFIIWKLYYYKTNFNKYIILLISIFYGIGIEIYQYYWVIGRSFDLYDIITDMFGAIAGKYFIEMYNLKTK